MIVETGGRQVTAGDCLADMLEAYGVTHIFYVPAIATRTTVAMEERTNITRVVTHGEKAAAYMADGYARMTGRPGVCLAQGVGGANLAAGLRDAWLAGVPLIAITGGPYEHSRGRQFYQQSDDQRMFLPVTKFSELVTNATRLPDLLRQAFRVSTTGRPGPVHLELKGQLGEVDEEVAELSPRAERRFAAIPPFRPCPEPEVVREAAALLAAAERPVIVAGGGVRASGGAPELLALAEGLGAAVVTSMDGKDTVTSGHPLNCGVVGLYSRKSANRVILEADVVLFAGSAMGGQATFHWQLPAEGTRVIQLDIDPEQLGRHYTDVVPLLGDAKVTLGQLNDALGEMQRTSRTDEWRERIAEIQTEWTDEYQRQLESDVVPLRPERLCAELSRVLPSDAVVVADTGHAGMWTAQMLDLREEGQGYLRAAGSLGWAFPAGIGAKMAAPDRPVVVFTGDGGFWYHIAELETAVRWQTGVVVVVNNNNSLNQEIGPLKSVYGEVLTGRHGDLWKFTHVDFGELAETMGAKGRRVTQPEELHGALSDALEEADALRVPVIVDVQTEITATAPLAYVPGD